MIANVSLVDTSRNGRHVALYTRTEVLEVDPEAVLGIVWESRSFKELGPIEAQACRHFVLAIIPWGQGDFAHAVDEALVQRGGDALVNVSVETRLYGFIPIYNVYSFACTTVQGIAVKFE